MKINVCRFAALSAALVCPMFAIGDVLLVEDGRICAEIVLPDDAWEVEK